MKVEEVRRTMRGLENRQTFRAKVRVDRISHARREKERKIRVRRAEHPELTEVVHVVARDDREPGVQRVVALLDNAGIVNGEHLEAVSGRALYGRQTVAMQHDGEGESA